MKECPACSRCFPDHVNHCPADGGSLRYTIAGDATLDGRYQLEKRIGQGGMGMVFKARHIFLKTQHAIKIILPDLVGNDPSLITRFRQEAMAAAAISHPNTISVTDFGVMNDTTPFLVMEFVEGRSLHEILQQEVRLAPERALEIMLAVCAGVSAAHRQGIVHRDLKPLNILLKNEHPASEGVKVLDFGLAKIKSGELLGSFVAAQTQGMMGSPFYMAPEQWSDEEVDVRADIYSLGVILYQMLAGDVPFKGASIPSIMKKHLTEPPPAFSARGVNTPGTLEGAVRHALEKEPDMRPASVEEFTAELRAALSAILSVAAPDGAGMQTIQISQHDMSDLAGDEGDGDGRGLGGSPGPVANSSHARGGSPVIETPREAISQVTVVAQPSEPVSRSLSQTSGEAALIAETEKRLAAEKSAREEAEARARAEEEERRLAAEEARQREAAEEAKRKETADREVAERKAAERESAEREAAQAARRQQEREAREQREAEEQARLEEEERVRGALEEQRLEAEEQQNREAAERERLEAERRQREEKAKREEKPKRHEEDERTVMAGPQQAAREKVAASVPAYQSGATAVGPASSRTPSIALGVVAALVLLGGIAGLAFYLKGSGGGTVNVNANTGAGTNTGLNANANGGAKPSQEPTKPDMVSLPGGTFQVGRNDVPTDPAQYSALYMVWMYSQWPAHAVAIKPFAIDRNEVTNAEYAEFVKATGHEPPAEVWNADGPKPGEGRWPVRNVSYEDAQAFAAWRSQRDGVTYRLPTEDEWEYAARGGDAARLYPWGAEWIGGRANFNGDAPVPVGSFPEGRTPQGVEDMIGNVWEWTSSTAAMYKGNNRTALLKEDLGKFVTRGGAYNSRADAYSPAMKPGREPVTATARRWFAKDYRDPAIGFRLVRPVTDTATTQTENARQAIAALER